MPVTSPHPGTTSREEPSAAVTLPPGQRLIERFPRFGTHLGRPAPSVPADPAITIDGDAIRSSFALPVADLAGLPRTDLTADFHCVAGWSAVNLRWEGVRFATFLRTIIEPQLVQDAAVTHLVFVGLDGYRSVVQVEDACGDDVLLADRLDGHPLRADHGAPVRLVSPRQYGYISTKHLCRIEVRSSAPRSPRGSLTDRLLESHPRARVWEEERHGSLPGRLVRPVYRALKAPILWLCTRNQEAAR
jgi:DMSO/TMAO reductase YedYZ molybdopterin-dependent catalytic subunit